MLPCCHMQLWFFGKMTGKRIEMIIARHKIFAGAFYSWCLYLGFHTLVQMCTRNYRRFVLKPATPACRMHKACRQKYFGYKAYNTDMFLVSDLKYCSSTDLGFAVTH